MPDYIFDSAEGSITFRSLTKIELKVGEGSSIVLDINGVIINGPNITETSDLTHEIKTLQADITAPAGIQFKAVQIQCGT